MEEKEQVKAVSVAVSMLEEWDYPNVYIVDDKGRLWLDNGMGWQELDLPEETS